DDATQTVVETVKNTVDGQINFTELTFNTAGDYKYTISEVQGNLGGVQYDTTDVKATISVTDNGQDQLQAALTFENGDNAFENSYSAAPGAASLSAKKVLNGRELKADEFEFV
ncbi:Spy0128 family protein, partial [Enterococcus faecium]|uniref:Spy0128 family protein n=1 Tax=Enterococcus faecium TaxID=1352 RepID=UPI0034E95091